MPPSVYLYIGRCVVCLLLVTKILLITEFATAKDSNVLSKLTLLASSSFDDK